MNITDRVKVKSSVLSSMHIACQVTGILLRIVQKHGNSTVNIGIILCIG